MVPPMKRALTCVAASLGILGCEVGPSGPEVPAELAGEIARAKLAARSDPAQAVALGQLQRKAGLLFDAAETLLSASAAGVNTPALHGALARTNLELGYAQSAYQSIQACFAIDRLYPECSYAWAMLLEEVSGEESMRERQATWRRFLAHAPEDHPKRPYAVSALAQLDAQLGPQRLPPPVPPTQTSSVGTSTAAPAVATSSVARPHAGGVASGDQPVGELNPFGLALQRAYAAWQAGDLASAAAGFEAGLTERPGDAGATIELARVRHEQGRTEEAFRLADAAYAAAPEDPQVRFGYGYVNLLNRRNGPQALAAWQALLRDDPDYAKEMGVDALLAEITAATTTTSSAR